MNPHRLGLAFGAQFPAAVLEVSDQFLLLRVDRDGRLAGRLKATHLGIDVLELGIAIGMAGPLARLAVGLKRETETPQQPADQLMAGRKAALGQRAGEMPLAPADPQQRRLRIAANGRLDKLGKRFEQSGLPVNRCLAAAPGPADPPAEMVLAAAKLDQSATDRAARHRGRRAYRLDAAAARRQRFARRNQPPTPLVKERRDRVKARLDGGDINHPIKISTETNRGDLYRDSIVTFFTNS